MALKLAPPPCDTEDCTATAVVFSDLHDMDSGQVHRGPAFCGECWAIVELVVETTTRIAKTGVPHDIAADWAGAAIRRIV